VPKRQVALRKNATESGIAAELSSLLSTITEDEKITDQEVHELQHWLAVNGESALPSVQFLRTLVDQILADGIVAPAQRKALQLAIERVLPAELRQGARAARMAQEVLEKAELKEQLRTEKEEALKERSRNRPAASFNFMVAGVTHEGRAGVVDEHLTPGMIVFLVREADNQFDFNAVRIITKDGWEIGYVPRDDAAQMAHFLDAGFKQSAYCVKILQGSRAPIPVIDATIYRPEATIPGALTFTLVPKPAPIPIPKVIIPERSRRRPTVSVANGQTVQEQTTAETLAARQSDQSTLPPKQQPKAEPPWWILVLALAAIAVWILMARS